MLLLGPIMSFVLTYSAMCVPVYLLTKLSPSMVVAGLLSIVASAGLAWLIYPIFVRFTHHYYACVIATVFMGVTTGWGPVGIAFVRRFTGERGSVDPMPEILPLNTFFIFPWMVVLFTKAMFVLFG